MNEQTRQNKAVNFWQVVILVLSFYVLFALAFEWLFMLPDQSLLLLRWIDAGICFIFIIDFFAQLWRAESKLAYLKWGWIDLVSSIPFLPFARWGRVVRIARILMLFRSVRSVKALLQVIFQSRIRGTFLSIALITAMLIILASVGILICETGPGSNIKTAGDAVWWAFSTVTSVGYGDFYPVTLEGRLIAAVLMTAGVALFTTLIAYFFSMLVSFRRDDRGNQEVLDEIRGLRQVVEEALKKSQNNDPSTGKS